MREHNHNFDLNPKISFNEDEDEDLEDEEEDLEESGEIDEFKL